MTATIDTRWPPTYPQPGRLIERTTTTVREIYVETPGAVPQRAVRRFDRTEERAATVPHRQLRGLSRAIVQLGLYLAARQDGRALRSRAESARIGQRVDQAKERRLRLYFDLPH